MPNSLVPVSRLRAAPVRSCLRAARVWPRPRAVLVLLMLPSLVTVLYAAQPPAAAPLKMAGSTGGGGRAAAIEVSLPGPDLVMIAASDLDACPAPTQPSTPAPNGATASRAQMLSSHTVVQSFNTATDVYLICVQQATGEFERQYGEIMSALQLRDVRELSARMHNGAVDVDHKIADAFNRQLHIYMAKGKPAKPKSG